MLPSCVVYKENNYIIKNILPNLLSFYYFVRHKKEKVCVKETFVATFSCLLTQT